MLHILLYIFKNKANLFENGKEKEKGKDRIKKKKKTSINKARYLICKNKLKGKNISNISNFPSWSSQSEWF